MAKSGPGKAYRKGLTFFQIADMFPDDAAAEAWFVERRWAEGPHCPHCGSPNNPDSDQAQVHDASLPGLPEARPVLAQDRHGHGRLQARLSGLGHCHLQGTSKIGDLSEDDGIEWAVTGPSHDEGRDFRGRLKPKSARTYRSSIDTHVLPVLGRKPALSIDHAAVSAFHHSLRETPAAANQAVEVLFRIYRAAEERETIPEGSNPCRQIALNRPRRHERFLTDEEFQRLGRALDEAEETGGARMYAAMAVRLLLLTGCRKNEIVNLHWDHVDLEDGEMRLPDTKTGPRTVQLSPAAVELLGRIPRADGNPHVIAGARRANAMTNLQSHWARIRERAGLEDMRLHDCRHSFASPGAGARREPADDRQDARPQRGEDDRALCASRPGFGA